MSSQVVVAHESNLVFYPNMWSGTCVEQHMNKSTSDNDDTHNVIYEQIHIMLFMNMKMGKLFQIMIQQGMLAEI